MKTLPTLLPSAIRLSLLALSPVLDAAAATDVFLEIDGKLRVHGAPLEGARVVVFHEGRTSQVITNDVSHIAMRLDLQSSYLLSFEREGCITKQLLFDTHVPANALADAPFSFPFKVTLEAMPASSSMGYVGPVGLISYDIAKADFDHDSKYTLVELDRLLEATLPNSFSASPALDRELLPHMDLLRNAENGLPDMAVRDRVPYMGLPIGHLDAATGKTDAPRVEPSSGAMPGSGAMSKVVTKAGPRPLIDATFPLRVIDKRVPDAMVPAFSEGRSEEFRAEKLRVTTIIRITAEGRTTEYRRIAHRYGPVYFFRNGVSCSETVYTKGVE